MNTLTKWTPFHEMDEAFDRFANVLGRWPGRRSDGREETMTVAEWAPLVDVTEDENEFLIKAELPGLEKKDVHVKVENGVLTITGERRSEKEEKSRRIHRIERSYGAFARSFNLPDGANADKVNAEFKNGVLCIHLPKDENIRPRAIEVAVS